MGPDIHLETLGRFHLPDVQPEHREKLFKNFPPQRCTHFVTIMNSLYLTSSIFRVNDMRFPNNLEGFFASKDGLKTQIGEAVSSDSKAAAEKGSCEKKTFQSDNEVKASNLPLRSASPCTSCPLCSKSFPLEVMQNYCKRNMC